MWGVTASDSAKGYVAWGQLPCHKQIDGRLVSCAADGSLIFAPDICLPALNAMKKNMAISYMAEQWPKP